MKHFCFLLFIISLGFVSCDEPGILFDQVQAKDYFPLETNRYWIYQVDSVYYNQATFGIDTARSYVKEEIIEFFISQQADTIFTIERSYKKLEDDDFQVVDIWSAYRNQDFFVKTEENLSFIKLTNPVLLNQTWDGNKLFDKDSIDIIVAGEQIDMYKNGWESKYLLVDSSFQLAGLTYDSILKVQTCDDFDIDVTERRFAFEQYAKNVGLIYKKQLILDTQCSTCETPWEEKAEQGFILEQVLIDYGN